MKGDNDMRDQLMFDLDAAPVFIALTAVAVGLHVVKQSRQARKLKRFASDPGPDANPQGGSL